MLVRIVSLLPAATEIVAALGLADRLVGRSHECDQPAAVATLPALTAPRIDPAASSRAIHEQVGQALGGAAAASVGAGAACGTGTSTSLYTLDIDKFAAIAPDLILTQAACDVCAIAAADVEAAVKKAGVKTQVIALSPATLEDVFRDVLAVGAATGRLAKAREVVARLKARVASVACRVGAMQRARQAEAYPTVAMIEWLDPPMAAGNWVPEFVRLAGGSDVLGKPGAHSHWITWSDVAAADPDVVVLVPCGFTLDRTLEEARSAAVRPHLEALRAFREGRCFAVDGHNLFNRPGPRLVDSLELLAEILHPGAFRFGVRQASVPVKCGTGTEACPT
ncbi:MAG: ABC transporter substrate-binding protein [Planctomycetia bacterium]|jgi:iron complex transport system substrate-binding protein